MSVNVLDDTEVTPSVMSQFHVVVMTGLSTPDLVKYNAMARACSPQVGFIAADVAGLAGRAFVDFGDAHTVMDASGEPPRSAIVTAIMKEEDGTLTIETHDAKRHGLSDGDHVTFHELEGAVELNECKPLAISNCTAYSFQIKPAELDGLTVGDFAGSGTVEQTRVPQTVTFGSLEERLAKPLPEDDPMGMLITPDLGKFGRPEQLHAAWAGLDAVRASAGGAMPAPHNADAMAAAVEGAKAWAAGPGNGLELEEDVTKQLARYAAVELPALGAFFGGVVAQEVVKFTGKFSPLRQWLYLDAFEVAVNPEGVAPEEFAGTGDRYHFSHVIFGAGFTHHVRSRRVFVVGAGALGCEFLKNYALAGVGTAGEGGIIVTDMDNIEVSNLNRQFLFRPKDVGAAKSVCAAAAARAMNPDLDGRVTALEVPVGHDTENTFNDEFWGKLSLVTNALDNLKARNYVDGRCVWYGLPLLESGTLGTKANTQVILPAQTESYSDSVDPPEESIPMCTLKNFPNAIEHCIEWARDNFEGKFSGGPQDAKAFASDPMKWLADVAGEGNAFTRRAKLQSVKDIITNAKSATWRCCVERARLAFEADYASQIKQLLHNFPPGHITSEGTPFWSGPKRCPIPAEFDVHNELHRAYVAHAAALYASTFGVALPEGWDTAEHLSSVLASVEVPAWKPAAVKIKADENDETVEGGDDDSKVAASIAAELNGEAELKAAELAGLAAKLCPQEFEKDDDSNHHIDFIAAAANLRASNYKISTASRHKVKMIAGKIIPAIATTTCMVTGLVTIELYKVLHQMLLQPADRKPDTLRNSFVNLAVNVYSMSEPGEPKRTTTKFDPIMQADIRALPEGHTKWEKIEIHKHEGVNTAGELIDFLKAKFAAMSEADAALKDGKPAFPVEDVDITMLLAGSVMLYSSMYGSHAARLTQSLKDLYIANVLKGGELGENYIVLSVSAQLDSTDNELSTPPVQLWV